MSSRPYFNSGIADLEKLFRDNEHNNSILSQLKKELYFRKTDRAQSLKSEIARAIAQNNARAVVPTVDGKESLDGGFHQNETSKSSIIQTTIHKECNEAGGAATLNTQPFPDSAEKNRLEGLYANLRERLLDLTKRNRMLSYSLGARSKKHLQIIDEVPEETYIRLLSENTELELKSLPEPDDVPADEKTEEFIAALEHAKVSDIEYLTEIAALESNGRDDEHNLLAAERNLRKRVRIQLGMPPRPERNAINRNDFAKEHGIDINPELPKKAKKPAHRDRILQTSKFPDELESTLEKISDDARLSEQEMGVSTLFLAFGFLEWYESDSSEKKFFAPLLLLPVKLSSRNKSGKKTFHLTATSGMAEANLSLQKFLEKTFNRALPDFTTEDEEAAGSVEFYFEEVAKAIDGLNRWHIRRWMILGHFAFGRLAMYADLSPENWPQHPASQKHIQSILSGTQRVEGDNPIPSIPSDYEIDSPEIEAINTCLIHDADASQHSALVDVAKNKDLVIEGPPGTGKSQTITNVIANALAAGKTVLFLAEKQAALEVVKRRLDIAGLGQFCLELHSDKSSSKQVVEALRARVALGFTKGRKPSSPTADSTWLDSRRIISKYLEALHQSEDDGRNLHDHIWESVRSRGIHPEIFSHFKAISIPHELLESPNEIAGAIGQLDILSHATSSFVEAYGQPSDSPWAAVNLEKLTLYDADDFIQQIGAMQSALNDIFSFLADHEDYSIPRFDELSALAAASLTLPTAPNPLLIAYLLSTDLTSVKSIIDVANKRVSITDTLKSNWIASQLTNLASDETLSKAEHLVNATKNGSYFKKLTPAQIHNEFVNKKQQREQILTAAIPLIASLSILPLDETFPAKGLNALSAAIICVGNLSPSQRIWIKHTQTINMNLFELQHNEWSELVASERRWRERTGYNDMSWPPSETIESAESILRQHFIGSLLTRLNGSRSEALRSINNIGSWKCKFPTLDEIAGLKAHVRRIENFEFENPISQSFGAAWAGLKTPFTDIATGLKIGSFLSSHLSSLPEGLTVLSKIASLNEQSLDKLCKHVENAKSFQTLPEEIRNSFSGSVASLRQDTEDDIQIANTVLSIDPSRRLDAVDCALSEIIDIVRLRNEEKAAEASLSASPIYQRINQIAGEDFFSSTQTALAWLTAVAESGFPDTIKQKLLGPNLFSASEIIRRAGQQLQTKLATLKASIETVSSRFGVALPELSDLRDYSTFAQNLLDNGNQLPAFLTVNEERSVASNFGLCPFIEGADSCKLSPGLYSEVFRMMLAYQRANYIQRKRSVVRNASGASLDARRKAFAERDKQKIIRDREFIKGQLLPARLVAGNSNGPRRSWTEMALLENEMNKQQRFIPLRTLISRSSKTLQALTPCFMMSPLSLAKFLKVNAISFDLVVIDEASQMRPEDALGGLLRAKQIIVVGDPKQLPPTDFFHRAEASAANDDEEADDLDDESILEACQKAFKEVRRLKWHYRSRCESLIAFSNEHFYDRGLVTFPMSKPGSFSIDLVNVDGHYQARQNVAEALRLAEDAIGFMRHHATDEANSLPTLGVVAINTDQRDLIREEIRRLSANDELVEQYQERVTTQGEPFFVKNLENVQGDERDVILISMTYGRERGASVVKQRFGPINGKHGHRRLNVLFSRARQRVVLYTSMTADDIKPSETSHRGVHILKSYLEYAANKGRTAAKNWGADVDSDFEAAVADRLRLKGYEIDYQVGVSGFRIDLGVRHPDDHSRYLVGIECDGATYHSSKSARDRDRLREEVLRGLGWELLRVWSTDWFLNPDEEIRKLIQKIEGLRKQTAFKQSIEYIFLTENENRHDHAPLTGEEDIHPPLIQPADSGPSNNAEAPRAIRLDEPDISRSIQDKDDEGPITPADAVRLLRNLRDHEIAISIPDWEIERSILREGMIETLLSKRVVDQDQWFTHVPQYQRQNTNKLEKDKYLDRICEIIERIDEETDHKREANKNEHRAPVIR